MEDKLKSSIGLRLFIIGVLSLVLLIPAVMIQVLISEREDRRESAVSEVSDKWGRAQTIAGPILTIPYQHFVKDDKGNPVAIVERAYVLPESLSMLLSISEHVSFNRAYLIASAAIIGLITAYTKGVLANNMVTAVIAGILVILYGFLFIVLQLQDYALLLGSIGLFVILAIVMYLTRKIDWFAIARIGSEASR